MLRRYQLSALALLGLLGILVASGPTARLRAAEHDADLASSRFPDDSRRRRAPVVEESEVAADESEAVVSDDIDLRVADGPLALPPAREVEPECDGQCDGPALHEIEHNSALDLPAPAESIYRQLRREPAEELSPRLAKQPGAVSQRRQEFFPEHDTPLRQTLSPTRSKSQAHEPQRFVDATSAPTRATRRSTASSAPREGRVRHASASESLEPTSASSSTGATSAGVTVQWLVPGEVNLGEAAACQLVVHNRGGCEASGVAVDVTLPENVRFDGADPEPLTDRDRLRWEIGSLAADQSRIILVRLAPQAEGNVTPTAAVTFTQASSADIRVSEPELDLHVAGPEEASIGQSASYQFTVTNRGGGAAVNVVVHLKLDPAFQHPQGERVEYRLGMLAAGESRTVDVPLVCTEPDAYEIAAAVTAGEHMLGRASHVVEITRPQLEVALEGPSRRYVERKATYVIRVFNPGPAVAENVHVLDHVPEGFRFVQASAGGSYDAQVRQVGWFVGRLEAEESTEVAVQLIPTEAGQHTLAAEVQADAGVIASAEATTRVEGVSTVVLELVDLDDPVEVGSRTVYELRVSNRGSIAARHVQVGARAPAELRIADAAGATRGRIDGGQVQFDAIDQLQPGETRVYRVRVECLQEGQATFRGFVRCDDQEHQTTVEELTRIYSE